MFSTTCSGRLAPVMTVETRGFFVHQAMDSWARVQPSSSATFFRPRTFSLRSGSVSVPCSHS